MNPDQVKKIFEQAEKEGRSYLLEPEVYALLRSYGISTPRFFFIHKGQRVSGQQLSRLQSAEVVIKIVSPDIVHKSDVGGVAFVSAEPGKVNRAIASMLEEVPRRFFAWQAQRYPRPQVSEEMIRANLRGVLVLERVDYEDVGFGSELLVGIRNSREFGPIVTMGLGGLDVEYINARLREGQALAIASAHLTTKAAVRGLLEPLAFYPKLTREFRGKAAALEEDELIETFGRFLMMARAFSPWARKSAYVVEEAEVNPFVIRGGKLVALDGMCRFSRQHALRRANLVSAVGFLLHPRSIGIIGVSERMNLGRIILRNILKEGFPRDRVYVVKPDLEEIEGCRCFPSVIALPETVDLFVLTLAAEPSIRVMEALIEAEKARSVVIIAGGLGEKKGSEFLEEKMRELLREQRKKGKLTPVVNGGNCMGIYSAPGKYDTTFIPEYKLSSPGKKNARLVYISQSGAFMAARMSKLPSVEPLYAISLGNQVDLTASDYLAYLNLMDRPDIELVALYIEGFKPGDGLALARAVREAVRRGRMVLVYKSGRTPEGQQATSSHTASVAGDYAVCRSVLETQGAFVAEDLVEFEEALQNLLPLSRKMPRGKRVALLSNAGFECVILADNLKNRYSLELAALSEKTTARLTALLSPLGIDRLQDVRNPVDLTPVADDATFAGCVEVLLNDPGIDCAVISPVPMTSALQTLPPGEGHKENIYEGESIARRLIELFQKSEKPFVVNIDAGALYQPLVDLLVYGGVPVFRHSDRALRFLSKFVTLKLKMAGKAGEKRKINRK